jgi:hypothetical protein
MLAFALYAGMLFLAGARFSLLAVLLLGGVVASYEFGRFQRAEDHRQAVVSLISRWSLLPETPPTPPAQILPVPTSIAQQRSWLAYVVFTPFSWVVLVLTSLLAATPASVLQPDFFAVSFVFATGVTVLSYLCEHQRILVSDTGITVSAGFRGMTIPWSEVRLFAIDAALRPTEPPSRYELSSETTIVRWSRARRASSFLRLDRPFPEYERHMEALLVLIATRTGRPLLDLRHPVNYGLAASQLPTEPEGPARLPSSSLPG